MSQRIIQLGCVIPSSLNDDVLPLLDNAIYSVRQACNCSGIQCSIILVTTTKRQITKLSHQPDKLIRASSELGFGAQNNKAISYVITKNPKISHILLLNDDASVDINFFSALKKMPQADVYIPLIFQKGALKKIDAFGMEIFQSGFASDSHDINTTTQWGTAACIIFSKRFIKRMIKTFDMFFNPHLYYYYEDVELFIRSMMLRPHVIKSSSLIAHHYRSFTSGKNTDFNYGSTLLSYAQYIVMSWPNQTLKKNWWKFLLVYSWLILKSVFDGRGIMVLKMIHNLATGLPRLYRLRRQITSHYKADFDIALYCSPYLFRTRKTNKLITI